MTNIIGLSAQEIDEILENEGMRPGIQPTSDGTRAAISKAIEENNKKLLEDVTLLIIQRTTSGHL